MRQVLGNRINSEHNHPPL